MCSLAELLEAAGRKSNFDSSSSGIEVKKGRMLRGISNSDLSALTSAPDGQYGLAMNISANVQQCAGSTAIHASAAVAGTAGLQSSISNLVGLPVTITPSLQVCLLMLVECW